MIYRLSSVPYFSYYSFFSLLFLCSYFFLYFFLKLPYYPYFLVQKCLKWPKIVIFFLTRFAHSAFLKIRSTWATMQKFIKYFTFSCNSFFGTFILVFPFHGNVVLLFRENFVCLLYLFLSLRTLRTSLLSVLFMIEFPTFALLFQNIEPYFIPTFSMEGTWKPAWKKNKKKNNNACIGYIIYTHNFMFSWQNDKDINPGWKKVPYLDIWLFVFIPCSLSAKYMLWVLVRSNWIRHFNREITKNTNTFSVKKEIKAFSRTVYNPSYKLFGHVKDIFHENSVWKFCCLKRRQFACEVSRFPGKTKIFWQWYLLMFKGMGYSW